MLCMCLLYGATQWMRADLFVKGMRACVEMCPLALTLNNQAPSPWTCVLLSELVFR